MDPPTVTVLYTPQSAHSVVLLACLRVLPIAKPECLLCATLLDTRDFVLVLKQLREQTAEQMI